MSKKFFQTSSIIALISLFLSSVSVKAMQPNIVDDVPSEKRQITVTLPSPTVSREAFLINSLQKLAPPTSQHYHNDLKKNMDQYVCPEEKFNEFFPKTQRNLYSLYDFENDKSYFSGQIKTIGNKGFGTGTITEIFLDNYPKISITGVTALHNFAEYNKINGKLVISPVYSDKFVLGFYTNDTDFISLGEAVINCVMVQETPSKDICLFKGNLDITKSPDTFKDINTLKLFEKHIPEIAEHEILDKDNFTLFMYHYPQGDKYQRKNSGTVHGIGKHEIESLGGSSGAAIYHNEKIIGIHHGISGHDLYENACVKYQLFDALLVTAFNAFEKICDKDYDDLTSGCNLYGGNLTSDFMTKLTEFSKINY